ADAREAVCLRLRSSREDPGREDGARDPRPRGRALFLSRRGRACGRDLPRARSAASEGGLSVIARLRGRPGATTRDGLVLDVGGGGYLGAATPSAVRKADGAEEVSLHTYLHVREDALQLYGFAEPGERELFVQLLSVNGVGPKVALAVVSGSPVA